MTKEDAIKGIEEMTESFVWSRLGLLIIEAKSGGGDVYSLADAIDYIREDDIPFLIYIVANLGLWFAEIDVLLNKFKKTHPWINDLVIAYSL